MICDVCRAKADTEDGCEGTYTLGSRQPQPPPGCPHGCDCQHKARRPEPETRLPG